MNPKDIAHIRRQFKPDSDLMKISDMFNVYIMKESSEIYHCESRPFALLDRDQQELFLNSFKRLLTGRLDERLFELRFRRDEEAGENHSQLILHQALSARDVEEWKGHLLRLVAKMLQDVQYSQDMMLTFIRGETFKPTRRRSEESEESERDEAYAHPYILCSISRTEQPQKSLMFDYAEREFKYNVVVDSVIKLTAPEAGFLFPCFTDNAADVNYVLYAAGKANEPDIRFIEEVLNSERTVTAREDKAVFEEIVREVTGDRLDPATLAGVYEEINRVIDESEAEEAPRLDAKDVERVLTAGGVEDVTAEKVEAAFERTVDDRSYEFKASSVLPKYTSKSIKINTKVANISISPQDLKYVKLVNMNGKRCLLIEVDEETVIEGFTMNTEF